MGETGEEQLYGTFFRRRQLRCGVGCCSRVVLEMPHLNPPKPADASIFRTTSLPKVCVQWFTRSSLSPSACTPRPINTIINPSVEIIRRYPRAAWAPGSNPGPNIKACHEQLVFRQVSHVRPTDDNFTPYLSCRPLHDSSTVSSM